jgi:hypothetical protein
LETHLKILERLEKKFGSREALALLLGTTPGAIYFWGYRGVIPDQFHAKILVIDDKTDPADLIKNFDKLVNLAEAMKR